MDKHLLQKYFRNQCSVEEIEQVLNWLQTKEGQKAFEENLDQDMERYSEEDRLLLYPDVPTDELLKKIKNTKKQKFLKKNHSIWPVRAVVAGLICTVLAVNYLILDYTGQTQPELPEITYRTISTQGDQHRLITLGDGTNIRLNSNSSIKIQDPFPSDERIVSLKGEAWFDIARDENRPFLLQADQASIRVLGTEFNVKIDSTTRSVQVAVAEGRVSLSNRTNNHGRGAILTKNTFAIMDLHNEEMLIEHTEIDNYLSWISGKLYFYNEPLWVVSRYLERIYNVNIQFQEEQLKELPLSTNIAKGELNTVLDIIGQTLDVEHSYENDKVLWTHKQ